MKERVERDCDACGSKTAMRQIRNEAEDILVIQLKLTDKDGRKIDQKKRGLVINRWLKLRNVSIIFIHTLFHSV
jgi:hypothetical protein